MSESKVWVFGYGSLVWKPGFEFNDSKVGFIKGYVRRFFQGNDVQRGSPQKLGRVATILEEEGAVTWGRAFQLKDETTTRAYLDHRESLLGGYTTIITQFQPRDSKEETFPVLIYVALPTNSLFLGNAPMLEIAADIAESEGNCGHNVEYLAKLAAFMRLNVPNVWDEHLFSLDCLVRSHVRKSNPQLLVLFEEAVAQDPNFAQVTCSDDFGLENTKTREEEEPENKARDDEEANSAPRSRSSSSGSSNSRSSPTHYTDLVPTRKLRCLNI